MKAGTNGLHGKIVGEIIVYIAADPHVDLVLGGGDETFQIFVSRARVQNADCGI